MNAEQRRLFEGALADDEADLCEQLSPMLRARQPGRRRAGSAAIRSPSTCGAWSTTRAEHTDCQKLGCGRPMTRIGEEISERLDIVPAEFFVQCAGRPARSKGRKSLTAKK